MKTDSKNMNKPDPLASRIVSLIDKHAAPVLPGRRGRRESGTPDTLVNGIGVPDTEHVNAMLQSGRLKSIGPVHKNDPDGPQRYESAHLNDVKREVLANIAEQVIEDYDGEPEDLPAAISAALASYLKSLNDGTAAKGFAAITGRPAVGFSSKLPEHLTPAYARDLLRRLGVEVRRANLR